jgi:hypothetical protein
MLPNLRFAIGAVLVSALLIVAAFGLAATVRVAHRQAATPNESWRMLAFTDPTGWGLLADRSQPAPTKVTANTEAPEVLPAEFAGTSADPDTTGAVNKSEPPSEAVETGERLAAPAPPPTTVTPSATAVAPSPGEPAADPAQTKSVEMAAAIPHPAAEPVQAMPATPRVETLSINDEPLEPSERVGPLRGFPTAGPGFVPLPPAPLVALPVPDPRGKVAVKQAVKKKTARRRLRFVPFPPFANTGYPATGFPETRFAPSGNEWKWTVTE